MVANRVQKAFKIDFEKLRKNGGTGFLLFDFFMLLIVAFNLSWILFDISFRFEIIQDFLNRVWPAFYEFYASKIHPNFIFYDLIFILIFIIELIFRWVIAVFRKEYNKWFFYPFAHWYDVLGCIPLPGFKLFRFLRVFSMTYRLDRMGVIDLKSTWLYRQFMKYLGILVEEVSDKVVVNVLSGVQDEVHKGNPVVGKIINEVIVPKQNEIVEYSSEKMGKITATIFEKHSEELRSYLETVVTRAVKENKEIQRVRLIPGVGKLIADILDNSISDITFNAIDAAMNDISQEKNTAMVKRISEDVFAIIGEEADGETDQLVTDIISDCINVIKSEVEVKQWKVKEAELKQKKVAAKFDKALKNKTNEKRYL